MSAPVISPPSAEKMVLGRWREVLPPYWKRSESSRTLDLELEEEASTFLVKRVTAAAVVVVVEMRVSEQYECSLVERM